MDKLLNDLCIFCIGDVLHSRKKHVREVFDDENEIIAGMIYQEEKIDENNKDDLRIAIDALKWWLNRNESSYEIFDEETVELIKEAKEYLEEKELSEF